MSRNTSQYYTAAPGAFQWSTDPANDDDFFVAPEDLGWVASALENHNHLATRGIPIGGGTRAGSTAFGQNSIPTAALQAGAITEPKLGDDSVSARTVADGAIAAAAQVANGILNYNHLATLTGDIAFSLDNGIIFGHGGWLYDFPTGGLTVSDRTILQTAGSVLDILDEPGSGYGAIRMAEIHNQGLLDQGGNLIFAGAGRQIKWPAEVGIKIDYTSAGTVQTGVSAGTLWQNSDGAHEWRVGGVQQMRLTSGPATLTVGGITVSLVGHTHGSGAPGDAATLEGHNAAYFATAASLASYAPLASPTFSGQVIVPAGSVGSPSILIGNTGDGLYSAGNDRIGLGVGGILCWETTSTQQTLFGPSAPAGTERVKVDGAVRGTGAYVVSTEQVKRDFSAFDPSLALAHVRAMSPMTYIRTQHADKQGRELGLVTEHLPADLRGLITSDDGDAVDLYGLTTLALAALQHLDQRLTALGA